MPWTGRGSTIRSGAASSCCAIPADLVAAARQRCAGDLDRHRQGARRGIAGSAAAQPARCRSRAHGRAIAAGRCGPPAVAVGCQQRGRGTDDRLRRRGAARRCAGRAGAWHRHRTVPRGAHGQGARRQRLRRTRRRGHLVGVAQSGRDAQPGAAEVARRLHLHAFGRGVRADDRAGAPARPRRRCGARGRHGRSAARHGQGRDAARGAVQAGQADRRRIPAHAQPSGARPCPAAGPRRRFDPAARPGQRWRARRLPAPP